MENESLDAARRIIDTIADQFEESWKGATPPAIAEFLNNAPEYVRGMLLEELILLDLELRWKRGNARSLNDYLTDFPHLASDAEALGRLNSAITELHGDPPDTSTVQGPLPRPNPSAMPQTIGAYRILEPLGQGGMGAVYKAEQRIPVQRIVAIKLMKPGFDTGEVVARFHSERQALARMDHPSIAKVLDAGADDLGRPYFVMEYVPGAPVTQFANDNRLTIRQRLELFIPICDAIAHAHTKSLIHRDIKAGNILAYMADGKARVKVIDFGVAKALTGDRLTDCTFNTGQGQPIGTYETMSPEQVAGSPDIDTRSDVYSLGVVLYELLTGVNPFDRKAFATATDEEVRRLIRDVEPPRPASRLMALGNSGTKIAADRRVDLRALSGQLRSELEWIPLKAMRKERDRRYSSPLELAEDIHNYLQNRPLRAGPESVVYRLRKTLRRNRAAVIMGSVIVLLITFAAGFYIRTIRLAEKTLQSEHERTLAALREARTQEKEAKSQASIAQAVNRFQREMLSAADPDRLLGDKVTVLQATQQAIQKLDDGALKDQPLVEAAVRDSIGNTLRSLGQFEIAEKSLRVALELRQRWLPQGHRDIAASMNQLAFVLMDENQLADATPLFRVAIDQFRHAPVLDLHDLATALSNLTVALRLQNKLSEAKATAGEALEIRRKILSADDPDIAASLNNLATVLHEEKNLADSASLYEESLAICTKSLPAGHPDIAVSQTNLGIVLLEDGKFDRAEPLFRAALAIRQRVLPAGHPSTAASVLNLARVLDARKKPQNADKLINDELAAWRAQFPGTDRRLGNLLVEFGNYCFDSSRFPEAERLYLEASDIFQKTLGADDLTTVNAQSGYGRTLLALGRFTEAEPILRKALTTRTKNLGPAAPPTRRTATALADLLDQTHRTEEANAIRITYALPSATTRQSTQ